MHDAGQQRVSAARDAPHDAWKRRVLVQLAIGMDTKPFGASAFIEAGYTSDSGK